MKSDNAHTPKPEWWTDEGLKALSLRVMAAGPSEFLAVVMRGHALAGHPSWEVGPRAVEEYKEAARCFQRAATLTSDPEARRRYIGKAVELNQLVADM